MLHVLDATADSEMYYLAQLREADRGSLQDPIDGMKGSLCLETGNSGICYSMNRRTALKISVTQSHGMMKKNRQKILDYCHISLAIYWLSACSQWQMLSSQLSLHTPA